MSDHVPSTLEKALALNLDDLKYGTVAEIGAGQEVARWFFQAGGAAGTIAKSMSAYDMTFSDEIYGHAPGKRYVSRSRLERMLESEFELVVSRIQKSRPKDSTFFAFANTVAAQGFNRRDECHGWMGVRFQSAPGQPPDEIIIHVRMLDDTNLEQQEALGILGVNLIYGAFFLAEKPDALVRNIMDNLKWGRAEIDLIEFRGPVLGSVDNRLMALELVKGSLARAVLFDADGKVVIPADALYKRNVLGMRGSFRPVLNLDVEMFDDATSRFIAKSGAKPDSIIQLAELTMAELANDGETDTADFLSRVTSLTNNGYHVLISEFFRHFRLRQYLARYTGEQVAIAVNVDEFGAIIREDLYDGLGGGLMEGLGKLFPPDTTVFLYPVSDTDQAMKLDELPMEEHTHLLVDYLVKRDRIVAIQNFKPQPNSKQPAEPTAIHSK